MEGRSAAANLASGLAEEIADWGLLSPRGAPAVGGIANTETIGREKAREYTRRGLGMGVWG
jgi:hypothetical protein